jgi:hypothetical protein
MNDNELRTVKKYIMKGLKSDFKMFISEKLLSLAFRLAPWNDEGQKIRRCVSVYYLDRIKEEMETTPPKN